METQMELILGVPLKVIAASYTLNLAADTAVKVLDDRLIPNAHRLSRVIGLDGLITFFGSFGLFLAFLICAVGITAGYLYISPANTILPPTAFSGTIFTGFSIFAGCTIVGTFVFFIFVMLVTLEVKGLLLTGFVLAAVLLMEYNNQPHTNRRVSSARMLILFSLAFFTILLAVQSSYNVQNPSLIIIWFFLVSLGYSTDKIAFKKPSGYIILTFIIAVVLTGFVLGNSIDEYYLKHPLLSETAKTVNSVVYKMVLLSGLIGALAGASLAYVLIEQEAKGLSLWICGPVAVILYNLDIDSHVSLHSLFKDVLGPGVELGLLMGFATASGISFGLALKYAHIMLPLKVICIILGVLGVIFYFLISSINLNIMAAIVLCLGLHGTLDLQDNIVPLQDVAWDFAILAKVMMGATTVGLAALLTGPLGEHAISLLLVALGVVTWKAWTVSNEQ